MGSLLSNAEFSLLLCCRRAVQLAQLPAQRSVQRSAHFLYKDLRYQWRIFLSSEAGWLEHWNRILIWLPKAPLHLAELGFPEDGSTPACHGKWAVNSLFHFGFFHLLYNHRITLSIRIWIVVNPVQFSVQKSVGILKIFFLIYTSSKETAQSCLMYISQLYSKSPNKTRSMSPTQLLQ